MNKFDEKYDIRFAEYNEIPSVMDYIGEFWKEGHILATNRDFFEYEHVIDGHVNFLIAVNREYKKIEGILGFIPASKNRAKLDIWGVVWKVCDFAMPMLGIELKKRLLEYTEARSELGVGANPKTSVPLLKILLKYKVHKMNHFYMLSDCSEYKIAKIVDKKTACIGTNRSVDVIKYDNIELLQREFDFNEFDHHIPCKDLWYINHRYFEHPVYKYFVYGLKEKGITKALIIIRRQEYKNRAAIRIVDYIGKCELFAGLNSFFVELLKDAEYIDFYCYGLDKEIIRSTGMLERTDDDPNIIPNYFNPYVCENIDIYVDSNIDNCMFFKADGDQDRPN